MGLIREPKNVNFTILDKPWTDKERKELSEFIKVRKEQRQKFSKTKTRTKKQLAVVL